MEEKTMKKVAITKVLSCFLIFVILISVMPVFITQSDAVILVENHMGKVVGKDVKNNELTVQIEYKADYSTEQVSWVPYHSTSQWAASMDAINEIQIGDYIEICDLSACIGKMKSSTEKVITDVYGDPDYLVPVHAFIEHPGVLNPPLLGNYIITYEKTPDCSKYHGIGISGCNVEAKYSDVTIRKENRQLKSQRLYPSQNYGYEDEEYKVDIIFNSGEAPAYPDCTDQPCFGPQAFSDFTIHIIESYKEVKFRGKVLVNRPIISFYSVDVKIDEILNDPTGKLRVGDVVTAWSHRDSPAKIEDPAVGDRVEVFGKYFGCDVRAGVESDYIDLETASHYLKIEKKPDLIIQSISCDKGSPKQGDTITFTVTVKNQGSRSAETSYVYYYIDGTYVTSDSVPGLSAGSTSTQTFTWTANKCGNVQVKAVADATNAVAESNEGNNQRVETINIGCPKIPAFESKGVYVWGFSTEFFKNENERERFFNLIKNDGIKTAFLSIDESLLADQACKEFVKDAKNENPQVHAMIGANWSAGDADKIDPFVRAVLKYNAENPNYMFSGIHLDAEPGDYPLKDFLGDYKEKLIDMKSRLNYNGETISSQKMALSIDVGCWWANEPNDLKDLIGVLDLDYITIMAYRDNATNITALADRVVSIAQEKGKPFVISVETQEFKCILEDGDFKPEQAENVTFFEEGQRELQQELEKLEENYKDELFKGFAIHYYQSSFTSWHIITDVIWPSGEFHTGEHVNITVELRSSDNFEVRPIGIGFSVRDENGNIYPDDFLDSRLDSDTSKIIVMEGRDKEELNLTWKVPEIAEEGWYDVTVAVWDIDFNENEPHESILLKDSPDITEITEIGMYNLSKMVTTQPLRIYCG